MENLLQKRLSKRMPNWKVLMTKLLSEEHEITGDVIELIQNMIDFSAFKEWMLDMKRSECLDFSLTGTSYHQ